MIADEFFEFTIPYIIQQFHHFFETFKHTFTDQQRKYLSKSETTIPAFHILPKLHKSPLSTRPIVGSPAWLTTTWSKYIDVELSTLTCQSVLVNSMSIIPLLEGSIIPPGYHLITADVSSLYTNIHLPTLYRYLAKKLTCQKYHLIKLLRLICENNFFEYKNDIYHQFHGLAMGTNCAVVCANLYMDQFDTVFAKRCHFYKRYIDDIFFIWGGSQNSLMEMQEEMNSLLPRITLQFSSSPISIPFLDINVNIDKTTRQIYFTTYQKPINRYGYLPPFSNHPTHTPIQTTLKK